MSEINIELQEQLKKNNVDLEKLVRTLRANHISVYISLTKYIYFADSSSNTNITALLDELGFERGDTINMKKIIKEDNMKSKYTTLLMENMLIDYKDMQNKEIMTDLQENVYPFYDELKKLKGFESVKAHISYVASHQEYSSVNIVEYLKKAIESYLNLEK
ncbi:MAG: hypothetical protein ACLRN5_10245 [Streptococcus lutetiensis]|nr:hypothetical protein [Streptococcus salivarius]MDU6989862.1 hypothetical protein [Escherichia coli]MDU7309312.1 hypothetical protein [Enterococcus faecalis]HBI1870149.1 hypothetical protein [Enterococcus faecalis]